MMGRAILAVTLATLVGLFTGCGSSSGGPETVPVSGTVYLDGEPLADAEVTFSTEEFTSFGKTGPDGTYELAQGAVPGEYKVSISKWKGDPNFQMNPDEGFDEGQVEAALEPLTDSQNPDGGPTEIPGMAQQLIPAEYNSNSQLTYPVPEGGATSADFRLRSQ